MQHPMIELSGVRKSFGSHRVLDGVDVTAQRGEIVALLGPNGAGKTTAVNILTTLIPADTGTARVAGIDVGRHPQLARRVISLTGQYASVDEFQTGRENLAMMCRLAHLSGPATRSRSSELLAHFDLEDAAGRRVSTYSGGMRRRLDLAISLIARPPVVVLDEPTTGLDPRSRSQMWSVVRSLAEDGTTILLTTQYLEEADRLADRIAVLDQGRVIATGTPQSLKRRIGPDQLVLTMESESDLQRATALSVPGLQSDVETLTVTVPAEHPVDAVRTVLAQADAAGLTVASLSIVKPSLDDVFLTLTSPASSDQAGKREQELVA